MLETQTCRSGLQLPYGSQAGSFLLQTGLLCWGCYPMALDGSQAPLCVCRVQTFLQMALSTLFSASSGFCEMPAVL